MLGMKMMQLFQEFQLESPADNEIAEYNQNTLIVGMSATADGVDQSDAYQYGMHFFCPKPTNMDFMGVMVDIKRSCDDINEAVRLITLHETNFFRTKTCPTDFHRQYSNASTNSSDIGEFERNHSMHMLTNSDYDKVVEEDIVGTTTSATTPKAAMTTTIKPIASPLLPPLTHTKVKTHQILPYHSTIDVLDQTISTTLK